MLGPTLSIRLYNAEIDRDSTDSNIAYLIFPNSAIGFVQKRVQDRGKDALNVESLLSLHCSYGYFSKKHISMIHRVV